MGALRLGRQLTTGTTIRAHLSLLACLQGRMLIVAASHLMVMLVDINCIVCKTRAQDISKNMFQYGDREGQSRLTLPGMGCGLTVHP